jgi:hypothetical protein
MKQKGAMFGLDARIALAIFGALSVISGAALYSAIQSAKAERYRQEFVEIIKGVEQYYLDTGKQLSVENLLYARLYTSDLINNRESLASWNGPYIVSRSVNDGHIQNVLTDYVDTASLSAIFLQQSSTWAVAPDDFSTDEYCILNSNDCAEWIVIGPQGNLSNLLNLYEMLDDLVDGGDGALSGTVRLNNNSGGHLMYKALNHKRIN